MASTLPGPLSGGATEVTPPGTASGPATTNPKMRKRTKTGCLTCRKRRIKCGEERPTCANCIKSKRQCEGYNQRVVFKPPIGDWPNHPGVVSTMQYHNSLLPQSRTQSFRSPTATQPQDHLPPRQFDFAKYDGPLSGQNHLSALNTQPSFPRPYQDASYQQPLPSPHQQQPLQSPHHQLPTPTTNASYFPAPSPVDARFQGQFQSESSVGYPMAQRYPQVPQYQHISAPPDAPIDQKPILPSASYPAVSQAYQEQYPQDRAAVSDEQTHYSVPSNAPHPDDYTHYARQKPVLIRYSSNSQLAASQPHPQSSPVDLSHAVSYAALPSHFPTDSARSSFQAVQIPPHDPISDVKYVPQHAVLEQPVAISHSHQPPLPDFDDDNHVSPTQVLNEAAVEYEDDDYYDVQSDEEMLDEQWEEAEAVVPARDFSLIQRLHSETTGDLSIRRYDSFIYEGVLNQYRAENVANPLRNPKTARVFAHFIGVTGPSLSIYERAPRNPTSILESSIPPAQQGLWTYIMPLKALKHQGLLHAMLALASLHIAKLQQASVTPSYKHYAYALKRLHRALGNPRKRLQLPTLATSLLLAFYEVTSAEHIKWSTHLVGAAQLLAELDFRSLTQEARRLRAIQTAQEEQFPYQNPGMLIDQRQYEQQLKESVLMPDEALVSTIVGKKVSYDDFGRVLDEDSQRHERRQSQSGKLDLRTYETLQDLHWWYARHDTFQSIISGNPLIMSYHKWSDCPPRAPLGRPDALFGSHDHIVLLIARIADFTSRDRERKLNQVDADGGEWRPRPGMPGFPMGPPQSQGGQPPTPTTPMGPPPHMQNMAPPAGWTGPKPAGWSGPPPGNVSDPPASQAQPTPPQPNQGPKPQMPSGPGFYGMAPSNGPASLPRSYAPPSHTSPHSTPNSPSSPTPSLPTAYTSALQDWNSIASAHATVAQILAATPGFQPLPADAYPPSPDGTSTPFGPALIHRSYDISILWTLLHLSKILLLRSHPSMPPAAMHAAGVCAAATAPYATLIGRITAAMRVPRGPLTPAIGAALIESTMSLFFAGIQFVDGAQRAWLVERLLEIEERTGWASAGAIARSCETGWERAAERGRGPG
ncbi:hypothetical protein EJ04DRAFT_593963, partial [Polyplosphaeria fusca]